MYPPGLDLLLPPAQLCPAAAGQYQSCKQMQRSSEEIEMCEEKYFTVKKYFAIKCLWSRE